ncbi:hypothetical protein JCM11491_003878 [Sporobolomyces phaffii]
MPNSTLAAASAAPAAVQGKPSQAKTLVTYGSGSNRKRKRPLEDAFAVPTSNPPAMKSSSQTGLATAGAATASTTTSNSLATSHLHAAESGGCKSDAAANSSLPRHRAGSMATRSMRLLPVAIENLAPMPEITEVGGWTLSLAVGTTYPSRDYFSLLASHAALEHGFNLRSSPDRDPLYCAFRCDCSCPFRIRLATFRDGRVKIASVRDEHDHARLAPFELSPPRSALPARVAEVSPLENQDEITSTASSLERESATLATSNERSAIEGQSGRAKEDAQNSPLRRSGAVTPEATPVDFDEKPRILALKVRALPTPDPEIETPFLNPFPLPASPSNTSTRGQRVTSNRLMERQTVASLLLSFDPTFTFSTRSPNAISYGLHLDFLAPLFFDVGYESSDQVDQLRPEEAQVTIETLKEEYERKGNPKGNVAELDWSRMEDALRKGLAPGGLLTAEMARAKRRALFPFVPTTMTQLEPPPRHPTRRYRVSALLEGHTDDVRALCAPASASSSTATPRLFSASRDATARSWTLRDRGQWVQDAVWDKGHEGFVNSVCEFGAPHPSRRDALNQQRYLATAGSDALIQVYSLDSCTSAAPVQTLVGHAHNVCCLDASKSGQWLASGSWDMTARVWNVATWECELVLVDHRAAVWDVLLLDDVSKDGQVSCLTAAADNYVRSFDGAQVRHLFKGHTGPVRALSRVLPDDPSSKLFASASNDGTIRIWNYATGDALTVLNHQDFVYSLVSIPSAAGGGLASSGEDGLIKVWNEEDGECDQVIEVPALSVWSLATLANGDLACGCSDKLIWIFSRDEERRADDQVDELFESQLRAKRAKRVGSPKPVVHEDQSVLGSPGLRRGEVRLVKEGAAGDLAPIIAYQWDGSAWENLGQVVDRPEPSAAVADADEAVRGKNEFQGKESDFVFQIDVSDDSPPIPFPYNLGDDLYELAKGFVDENRLPASYLDQIVEFVRSNTATM